MARPLTREAELKAAIVDADMPPRDLKVFMVLMKKATWVTAKIKDEYQPRSLEELARWAHMSEANLKRSLNHLQRHGWIQRYRYAGGKGIGGRGHPTHYQLDHGRDCDCKAHKGAQDEPVSRAKGAQKCPIKGLKSEDITAGQTPVSAKSVREEEGLGEGEDSALTRCTVCQTPMDPVLPALGYSTHPCCDPDETPALANRSNR